MHDVVDQDNFQQIDYIVCSKYDMLNGKKLSSVACCKTEMRLGRSDHFPVLMSGFGNEIKKEKEHQDGQEGIQMGHC